MNPHQHYRRSSSFGWTRIDMLIHVYNHAINSLRKGADVLAREGSPADVVEARIDAQRKVLLITDGLALDHGEVPVRILQLCVFILDQLQSDSVEAWKNAAKLLETVREGFLGVQDAARKAEQAGEIPALQRA